MKTEQSEMRKDWAEMKNMITQLKMEWRLWTEDGKPQKNEVTLL